LIFFTKNLERFRGVFIIKPHGAMLLLFILSTIFGVVLGSMVVFYFLVYIEDHRSIPLRRVRRDKGLPRGPNKRTRIWPEVPE